MGYFTGAFSKIETTIRDEMKRTTLYTALATACTKISLGGTFCGLCFGVLLNVIPFAQSYRAYNGDGYEVVGFPLIFRRSGGFNYTNTFNDGFFIVDCLFTFILVIPFGVVFARWNRKQTTGTSP